MRVDESESCEYSGIIVVQNRIFTAESPRTPRIKFLFGGEMPPNKSLFLEGNGRV
jgi:hypothetical protein